MFYITECFELKIEFIFVCTYILFFQLLRQEKANIGENSREKIHFIVHHFSLILFKKVSILQRNLNY